MHSDQQGYGDFRRWLEEPMEEVGHGSGQLYKGFVLSATTWSGANCDGCLWTITIGQIGVAAPIYRFEAVSKSLGLESARALVDGWIAQHQRENHQ